MSKQEVLEALMELHNASVTVGEAADYYRAYKIVEMINEQEPSNDHN